MRSSLTTDPDVAEESSGLMETFSRFMRYAGVSVVNVLIGQTLLIFFKTGLSWSGTSANIAAVTLGAIPAYFMSRAWVWSTSGRPRLWAEVVPFLALSLLGLLVSTGFVALADRQWGTQFAVSAANIAGFGVVWVLKYVVLDRVLFNEK